MYWLAEFERELLGFPGSRHGDQVDALAQLLGWTALAVARVERIFGPIFNPDQDDPFGRYT